VQSSEGQTMTRLSVLFAASVAVVMFAGSELGYAASRMPTGLPPSAALLLRFDADHDGIITKDEMEAALKADYAAADTDGNNCLSPAEVRAENERRLKQDGQQASPLVDWNIDGCVDMREFSNTAHSYFDLADRSKDGRLSANELRGPSMPIPPRVVPTRQQQEKDREQQQANTPSTPAVSGYSGSAYGPGSGSGLPGSYAGY
jgi:Ca2+-binding EF-hand superfamily protein